MSAPRLGGRLLLPTILAIALGQAHPVRAQSTGPFYLVLDTPGRIYATPSYQDTYIGVGGLLRADAVPVGTAISLGGNLENLGRVEAAFGTEVQGLHLAGEENINRAPGVIEAHWMTVGNGAILLNEGTLRTGAFTIDNPASPYDGLSVTHEAFAIRGIDIAPDGGVRNEGAEATWRSFADITVGGFLANGTTLHMSINPQRIQPSDTLRWLTVNAGGSLETLNTLTLDTGTGLRNSGLVVITPVQDSTVESLASLANGTRLINTAQGFVTLTQGATLRVGSATGATEATRFENDGLIVNRGGRIVVDGDTQVMLGGGAASRLESSGVIDIVRAWVTNEGVFVNEAGSRLHIRTGSDWDGFGQHTNHGRITVDYEGSFELAGRMEHYYGATMHNEGIVIIGTSGTWISGSGSILNQSRGTWVVSGEMRSDVGDVIENQGIFSIVDSGFVQTSRFLQTAGRLVVDGRLQMFGGGTLMMTGGTLSGVGRINGAIFVGGSAPPDPLNPQCSGTPAVGVACFKPGNSPGTFEIDGDLVLGEGGVIEIEIERGDDGLLSFDQVVAQSITLLAGSLVEFHLGAGVAAGPTVQLAPLRCLLGPCDFQAASFAVFGDGLTTIRFDDSGALVLEISPVPEPGSWALWLAGLAGVARAARRRAASHRSAVRGPNENEGAA